MTQIWARTRAYIAYSVRDSWENKRRPAGNRASNPADLSNGATRMIIAPDPADIEQAARCLCGHPEDDHDTDHTGGRTECARASCGCSWYRPTEPVR